MSFLFISKDLRLSNIKTRTTINAKISVFVIWVEAIIYFLLYNLHDCTLLVFYEILLLNLINLPLDLSSNCLTQKQLSCWKGHSFFNPFTDEVTSHLCHPPALDPSLNWNFVKKFLCNIISDKNSTISINFSLWKLFAPFFKVWAFIKCNWFVYFLWYSSIR